MKHTGQKRLACVTIVLVALMAAWAEDKPAAKKPAGPKDKTPVVELSPLPQLAPLPALYASTVTPGDPWLSLALMVGSTDPVEEGPRRVIADTRLQPTLTAVQLLSTADPLLTAALLDVARKEKIFPFDPVAATPPVTPTKAERLDLTDYIVLDKEPLAVAGNELEAYAYVIGEARKMPNAALKAGAKPHITYPHMFKQSQEYRGEVVQVKGFLRRLRKYDKPHKLLQNQGIKAIYEGWVLDPKQYGPNPVCIVFTELPKGFEVGEVLYKEIEFYGYFFKIIEYESGEVRGGQKVGRYSPIIIGRGPIDPHGTAPPPVESINLMNLILGLVAGTLALALGLVFWYRYSDRKVRDRITQKPSDWVEPTGDYEVKAEREPPPEPLFDR